MISALVINSIRIKILTAVFFIPMVMSFQEKPTKFENQAPIVRITTPTNNGHFNWNTEIQYSIHISDKEDGNSDYDEINSGEVLVQIAYLADSTTINQFSKASQAEPFAISIMKLSTCFSCHTSRNKLIGPSFDRIANRYQADELTIERLTQKVMHGSQGTWGEAQMPSHTDLKPADIKQVVKWIIENNKNTAVFYQVGLKGSFRTKEKAESDSKKSMYVITASYLDHGLSGNPDTKKRGQHRIIIRP